MVGGPQRQRDAHKCSLISDIWQQKEEYNGDYTHAVQMSACTRSNKPFTSLVYTVYFIIPTVFMWGYTCIHLTQVQRGETRQKKRPVLLNRTPICVLFVLMKQYQLLLCHFKFCTGSGDSESDHVTLWDHAKVWRFSWICILSLFITFSTTDFSETADTQRFLLQTCCYDICSFTQGIWYQLVSQRSGQMVELHYTAFGESAGFAKL